MTDHAPPSIGFVAGHLPTYYALEHDVVSGALADLRAAADRAGVAVVGTDVPVEAAPEARNAARAAVDGGAAAVVVLHAAFTMGEVTEAVAEVCAPAGVRVVVWTVDEPTLDGPILLNSYVSGLMGASILRATGAQDGADWLHGRAGDPAFDDHVDVLLGAVRARHALRTSRIGFLGGVAPGFVNFEVDAGGLADRLGPTVVADGLADVFACIRAADPDESARTRAAIEAGVDRSAVTVDRDVDATAATVLALRGWATDHACTALAVSDWSEFQDEVELHPGMAFSWLDATDALPVACEGDVVGATSMVALRAVAGTGACLLDVVSVAPDRSALQLWHCGGSPLDLADDAGVGMVDHSTLGRKVPGSRQTGAVADLVLRPGPVTVLRFGNDLSRALVAEAIVVPGPSRGYDGTRGWVADWRILDDAGRGVEVDAIDVARLLVERGVEHHVALVGGHHGAALAALRRWLGLAAVGPG